MLKYKVVSHNFVLNEVPNNNDAKHVCIANIVLNEAPNSNYATHVGNNVRLTAVDTKQFSIEDSYIAIMQKKPTYQRREIMTR